MAIWTVEEEAAHLRERFEGVNKAKFARDHAVPGAGAMIHQHMKGMRPISLECAIAYAKGFGVELAEISPRLAADVANANQVNRRLPSRPGQTVGPLDGAESQGVAVPALTNGASMGPGSEILDEDVVKGHLTLSPTWIGVHIKPSHTQSLRFIHGYGDSMAPTFKSGDILLVDTGIVDHRVDGIYVLKAHDRLFIKRVRKRMDGSIEVSSDNPTHKTVDVLNGDSEVTILGRVVWAWNGLKL